MAAEKTWNAKAAHIDQYQVVQKGRDLNGFWAGDDIESVRQNADFNLNGLTQDQATLRHVLVKSEECLPGMSREALSTILLMLNK
ncbi:hypothetical protein [Bdellovibrio svalbardensis]|uniref:hypothetical protein n=1 Tax=Bdellovibrio svalbardensis TaxID=2972972 RepID=UPI0024081FC3|nr:hypothetical protein [Bdellovibrio svalbardensis]